MSELAINGGTPVVSTPMPHYTWPRISNRIKHVVSNQLDQDISIYNRAGVFGEFEDAFAKYIGQKKALLFNSGTNALFAAFDALELGPGDEIIAPTYTFFATVSPVTYLGCTVVCADCYEDGNISADQIARLITPNTKAVVVTHMWGVPCDMRSIVALCKEHNLRLVEDCSHAHGASLDGAKLGSFGDVAVFSLQGQKILTGGEGGVLLTSNDQLYYRGLLHGHYNKRCRNEIPSEDGLFEYSLTGFGLKHRAHPLAVAMVNEQLKHLDGWVAQKNVFASEFTSLLQRFEFVRTPQIQKTAIPSWYAYVFHFDARRAGTSRSEFVSALQAEGMVEVDVPSSTRPIHSLPLFRKPEAANRRFEFKSDASSRVREFPNAEWFYRSAIKLPIWAYNDEAHIVQAYLKGLEKVCSQIHKVPSTQT